MGSYRLVDSRRCRLKSAAWTEDKEKPEKMVPQPQLGPNQTTRLQARLVLQRGCGKCQVEGATVWSKIPSRKTSLYPTAYSPAGRDGGSPTQSPLQWDE